MATSCAGRPTSTTTTATTPGARWRRCKHTACRRRTRPNSWASTPGASTTCRRRPTSSANASLRSSARTGGRRKRKSAPRCGPRRRSGSLNGADPTSEAKQSRRDRRAARPDCGARRATMTSTSGPAQKVEERMATKDFVVFDGDSHVVEPPLLWEEYLDPEYRTLGKHALWRQEGRTGAYLKVNGEIFRDKGNPNLPRHALGRPGMAWDAIGALDPHVKHPVNEGAAEPASRLADMDAMGVDQTLLYPTWVAGGVFLVRDP